MRSNELSEPLGSFTIKESITGIVTKAILSGQIRPGERLNESQLSRDLKVSRAPIREALQHLERQGLVINQPRRGMFVVSLDDQDIQKINGVRLVLEAYALRLCRANLTRASATRIRQALDRLERAESASPAVRVGLDLEFHRAIWRVSGNEYLEKVLNDLVAPLFAHSMLRILKAEKVRHVIYSHRPLLAFIRRESEESAEDVIANHLTIHGKIHRDTET